jgi:hypothetical protein
MKFFITIVFAFIAQAGISQYKQVPLTNAESRNGVLRHGAGQYNTIELNY